jgi:predicted transcriptional regulator
LNKKEFTYVRKKLNKTQKEIAELLGTSIKAVHSYEQGWRKVPGYVERQVFFLVSSRMRWTNKSRECWIIKKCPPERKKRCPAWEFRAGKLCWFISGTICGGAVQKDWDEKMKICRSCKVLISVLN